MAKSALMRPLFAEIAWDMFQDRPVFGVGFAQYSEAKERYLKNPHTTNPLLMTRELTQHNVFLAYLVDMGIVGMGTLTCLLLTWIVSSWQVWRNQSLDLWPRQCTCWRSSGWDWSTMFIRAPKRSKKTKPALYKNHWSPIKYSRWRHKVSCYQRCHCCHHST